MIRKRFKPQTPRVALLLAALAMSALSIAASIVLPAALAFDGMNPPPTECVQARAGTDQQTD